MTRNDKVQIYTQCPENLSVFFLSPSLFVRNLIKVNMMMNKVTNIIPIKILLYVCSHAKHIKHEKIL